MSEFPTDLNPYAAPNADLESQPISASPELAGLEMIRNKYLKHEAAVRSIGSLYYLSAIILAVFVVILIFNSVVREFAPTEVLIALVILVPLAFSIVLGRGLRSLHPWARWVGIVIAAFPFVTTFITVAFLVATGVSAEQVGQAVVVSVFQLAIPSYILYLLASKKGNYVFTHEYREVVASTPHIKYKTSCILRFALILLIVVLVLGVIGVATRR